MMLNLREVMANSVAILEIRITRVNFDQCLKFFSIFKSKSIFSIFKSKESFSIFKSVVHQT